MSDCHTNNLQLDFLSWHYYNGQISELYYALEDIASYAAANSLTAPPMIIGEWYWALSQLHGSGNYPLTSYYYQINDWSAAFIATSLITMQSVGVLATAYNVMFGDLSLSQYTGLVFSTGVWANLNVYKMWNMLAANIVTSTVTGDPGVQAIASVDGNGKTTVFVSSFHYRGSDIPVTISVPGLSSNASVTYYVVDSGHSNYKDNGTGPDSSNPGSLETITPPTIQNSTLQIIAKARSVHLLVIQN